MDGPHDISRGRHTHTATLYFTPERYKTTLIKSEYETKVFPAKAGMLSYKDLSGSNLIEVTPTGILSSNESIGNEVLPQTSSISNSTMNGEHNHYSGDMQGNNGPTLINTFKNMYNAGRHAHINNLHTIEADDIRRYHMRLWESATDDYILKPGYFGLWESIIPPQGWSICNGKNGTPDLTNYFINFNTALAGTQTGDGSITVSGKLQNGGSHNHMGTPVKKYAVASGYHGHFHNPDHNRSIVKEDFEPQYYTLIMIQYTG
jgi:hypothetical protein